MITGLGHIGIRVHDMTRALAFYQDVLGFVLVAGPFPPEPVAILRHPAGVEINLIGNAARGDAPNILLDVAEKHAGYTHVALVVANLEAAQARLTAAGVAITEGPITFPGGVRAIFCRDPDRNVVELDQLTADPAAH